MRERTEEPRCEAAVFRHSEDYSLGEKEDEFQLMTGEVRKGDPIHCACGTFQVCGAERSIGPFDPNLAQKLNAHRSEAPWNYH